MSKSKMLFTRIGRPARLQPATSRGATGSPGGRGFAMATGAHGAPKKPLFCSVSSLARSLASLPLPRLHLLRLVCERGGLPCRLRHLPVLRGHRTSKL